MRGTRYCLINENKEDSSYPRCGEKEYWSHLMQYECVNEMKEYHLNRLKHSLLNAEKTN